MIEHTGLIPEAPSPLYDASICPGTPERCEGCGDYFEWSWWERRETDGKNIHSRWFHPVIPCNDCRARDEHVSAAASFSKRQAAAGIPKKYRGHSWDRTERIGRTESPAAFRRRVLICELPTIGIWGGNDDVARSAMGWRARRAESMWLEGKPGGGKTLFAAATASRALIIGQRRKVQLFGEDHPRYEQFERAGRNFKFVGGIGRNVLMVNEDELHARARLSWDGNRAPLKRISKASILILDELGSCGRDKENSVKAVHRGVADTIEKLIAFRYERKLPTLITSNEPMHHCEALYGKRVMSRLAEMIPGGGLTIGGQDWRTEWT